MNIHPIPYCIPLSKPIKTKHTILNSKNGFYFYLEKNHSITAVSELAHLPGFNKKTLSEILDQFYYIKPQFLRNLSIFKENPKRLLEFFRLYHVDPSLGFCLYSLTKKPQNLTNDISISLQGMLYGSYEDILQQASTKKYLDFSHIKIKVNHLTVGEAISLIPQLFKILGHDKKFRIDIGLAWNIDQLEEFLTAFNPNIFDYIEDPLLSLDQLHRLLKIYEFNLGLDELCRIYPIHQLSSLKNLKALIVKPSLDPHFFYLHPPCGLRLILSSSYESPLGLYHIAHLANTGHLSGPHGLDTLDFYPKIYSKNYMQIASSQMILNPNIITYYQTNAFFSSYAS